jgi:signal transduction histidine kinase/Flp pilus assembly protein TadD
MKDEKNNFNSGNSKKHSFLCCKNSCKSLLLLFLVLLNFSILSAQTPVLDSLKTKLKTVENEEKVEILNTLCKGFWFRDFQASINYGKQAISLSEKIGYQQGFASGHLNVGGAYHINDQLEEGLKYYQIALTEFRRLKNEIGISQCLNNIGNLYYDLGEREKALLFYEESLQLKQKLKDEEGVARTLNNLGKLYNDWGNTEKSLEYHFEGLKIREKMNDGKRIAISLNNIGITYAQAGNLEQALSYYLQSLKIKEEFDDKRAIAITLSNIAGIYADLKQREMAISFYEKALQYQTELNDKKGISSTMQSLANQYHSLNELVKAESYYRQTLQIKKEIKDNIGIATASYGLAQTQLSQNKYQEAESEFLQVIALQKQMNDDKNLANTYLGIAHLYKETGSFEKAKKYYREGTELAQNNDSYRVMLSGLEGITNLCRESGDFENAYLYLQQHTALKDSLFNEVSSKNIAELKTKFETEQKEKEIRFLTTEQEKNRLIRNYLLVFSFFVLIIALLLYFLYLTKTKENKRRRASEAQILELNRTLEQRVKEEVAKLEKQQILLMQKSKLESLGRLSAGIAHEINQPVTRLSLGLDNVLIRQSMGKLDDSYLSQKCKDLFSDIDRIRVIIDHVRTFSREQSRASLEKINPNSVIENAIMLVQTQFKNHQVKLNKELDENIGFTLGNAFQLEQVMMNLLSNAKDAVEDKAQTISDYEKEIFVKTYQQENRIYLEVRDNGTGISEEALAKIFDPFYTTKSAEKGTGLGLSISYGIIKEMNGDIEVDSKDSEFTLMRIILPEQKKG